MQLTKWLSAVSATFCLSSALIAQNVEDCSCEKTQPPANAVMKGYKNTDCQAVQNYFNAWNCQCFEKLSDVLCDDFSFEDVAQGVCLQMPSQMGGYMQYVYGMWATIDCLCFEVENVVSTGDKFGFEATLSGTFSQDLPGFPPSQGRSFKVRCAGAGMTKAGKIQNMRLYYDLSSLMKQLMSQ